jgi:hypothetical protein
MAKNFTFPGITIRLQGKLLSFQKHEIHLQKANNCLLGQAGNTNEMLVFWKRQWKDLSGSSADSVSRHSTITTTCDSELKNYAKGTTAMGLTIRYQTKGWITNELISNLLQIVWNKRQQVSYRKQEMFVLNVFKGHLILDIRMNTDLMAIPEGMV